MFVSHIDNLCYENIGPSPYPTIASILVVKFISTIDIGPTSAESNNLKGEH
jgi:hypothetical protein